MLTKRQKDVLNFIKNYIKKNEYAPSLKEIADEIGVSSVGTVYDHIKKLENKGYLTREKNQPRAIEINDAEDMIHISLSGLITAGAPIEAIEEKESIAVPKRKLPKIKDLFALKVKGESMIKENIEDGDIVIVKKQKTAEAGQKVVALINNDEATLKKIYKKGNKIILKPANKRMDPIVIDKKKDIEIQGIVVDVIKKIDLDKKTKSKKKKKRSSKPPTNQIITGDVIKEMQKIPSESVHLAITSPPYNVGKNYDNHNDNMGYQEYLDWLNKVWKETRRILVPGGRFALNIAPTGIKNFVPLHHDFTNQFRKLNDMKFRTEIIWYKQTMLKRTAWGSFKRPSNPHIVPSWEYILIFSKNKDKLDGDKNKADITKEEFKKFSDGFWQISPETKRKGHPAPFPEKLIYRLVKFYSYEDNVVLDMFGGTGTVATVAAKTNRKFIHIDVSEDYNKVAKKRVRKINSKLI